jgi:hypothetical protein
MLKLMGRMRMKIMKTKIKVEFGKVGKDGKMGGSFRNFFWEFRIIGVRGSLSPRRSPIFTHEYFLKLLPIFPSFPTFPTVQN